MNRNNLLKKLKEIETNKNRRKNYALHLQRQERRLAQIGRILNLTEKDARTLTELVAEYLQSARYFRQGTVKIARRIT